MKCLYFDLLLQMTVITNNSFQIVVQTFIYLFLLVWVFNIKL